MAAALSALVLAGVLSAFGFIAQTSQRAASYSHIEAETRGALEAFARDARAAVDVRWQDSRRLRLVLPDPAVPEVLYGYDDDPVSPTFRSLYRQESMAGGGTGPRRVLVREVAPDFQFQRYRLAVAEGEPLPAANDLETKQIQVVLRVRSAAVGGGAAASQSAISARYVLRNKKVTN